DLFHGGGRSARDGSVDRLAWREHRRQQSIAPYDVRLDREQVTRPALDRHPAVDERSDRTDASRGEPRYGAAVDEQRRPLITQARATRGADRDEPVPARLAELDMEGVEQAAAQLETSSHHVRDVVTERDAK